jgi:phospholipid transport system substrate-binding protein
LAVLWVGLLVSTAVYASDSAHAEVESSEVAVEVIERFEAVLLEIMKRADEIGYQGRLEVISPALQETFDMSFMARKTIGRYWKDLSDAERDRWLSTFGAFIDSNFADRFDGFSGETFEVVGQKPASQSTLVVLTKLIRPEHDDVELNYRMREADDSWKVVDIYSGGKVSEVALRRSEFASLLKQGGIEKLIESVSAKTKKTAEKH